MTNYEKIKAISLDEMAGILLLDSLITPQNDLWDEVCVNHWECDSKSCLECVKEWLGGEAEA